MAIYSQRFPKFISMDKVLPGPAFFPTIIGILLILFGVYLIIKNLPKLKKLKEPPAYENQSLLKFLNSYSFQNFLIFFFLTLVYPTVINYIGFYLGTFLYCIVTMKRLKVKWITAALSSILIIFIIWIIFHKIAFIPLPQGYIFRR